MMVWENVLFLQMRNINSDGLNGESVYSSSVVTEITHYWHIYNAYAHTHMDLNVTTVKIFHLLIHLLIVTLNNDVPDPESKEIGVKPKP